jgi:endonuclease YncB( thermonuclease family)
VEYEPIYDSSVKIVDLSEDIDFLKKCIIATIAPPLVEAEINKDGLQEFYTEDEEYIVFVDDEEYVAEHPLIPFDNITYSRISDESGGWQYKGNVMVRIQQAGLPIGLLKKLLKVGGTLQRLKWARKRKFFKFDKKTGEWKLAEGVTLGYLILGGLNLGGTIAKGVIDISLTLIGTKTFMNFICEEGLNVASMSCYIAAGRSPEALETALNSYKDVYNLSYNIITFANEIPVLQQLQVPFIAFLEATKTAITVYEQILLTMKNKEAMKTAKDAGILNIYSEDSYRITVNGIRYGKYSPVSMPLSPGSHKIELSKKTCVSQTFDVSMAAYEVKSLGSFENPIKLELRKDVIPIDDGESGTKVSFTFIGKVVDVKDGDTISLFERNDKELYDIRLNYIDAAELSHKGSRADWGSGTVANLLSWLIEKEEVTVNVTEIDHYGRYVGTIYLQDLNVNLFLVKIGAVRVYHKYLTDEVVPLTGKSVRGLYTDAEEEAKKFNLGIWSYSGNPKLIVSDDAYVAKGLPIPEKKKDEILDDNGIPAYKNFGYLRVYATEKYKIYVDGFYKAVTERQVKLIPGTYEIMISGSGKKDYTEIVGIHYNEITSIGSKESKIKLEDEG